MDEEKFKQAQVAAEQALLQKALFDTPAQIKALLMVHVSLCDLLIKAEVITKPQVLEQLRKTRHAYYERRGDGPEVTIFESAIAALSRLGKTESLGSVLGFPGLTQESDQND